MCGGEPVLPAALSSRQDLFGRHRTRSVADIDDYPKLLGRRCAVPVDCARVPQDQVARFAFDLDLFDAGLSFEPFDVLRSEGVAEELYVCDQCPIEDQEPVADVRAHSLVQSSPTLICFDAARLFEESRQELMAAAEQNQSTVFRTAPRDSE
jgi:hypothetical protein